MSNVNGPEHAASRGNFAFTTINLPYLALQAKKNLNINLDETVESKELIDEFFKLFNKYIHLGKKYLEWRFEIIAKKKVYNYPFVFAQGLYEGSEKLKLTDEIKPALLNASLSIGFVGLAECLVALIGKHHGESEEAQKLGLKIVKHLRAMTTKFTEETHLNWSTFASPSENFCGVSLRAARKDFGIVKKVTDRDYFTNGSHVPTYYECSAKHKIEIEAPYHRETDAGNIAYIEFPGDPLQNLPAFEKLIKNMVEADMGYISINHPVDYDPICGYTGIIANECPHCHRREDGKYKAKVKRYKNND